MSQSENHRNDAANEIHELKRIITSPELYSIPYIREYVAGGAFAADTDIICTVVAVYARPETMDLVPHGTKNTPGCYEIIQTLLPPDRYASRAPLRTDNTPEGIVADIPTIPAYLDIGVPGNPIFVRLPVFLLAFQRARHSSDNSISLIWLPIYHPTDCLRLIKSGMHRLAFELSRES